MNKYEAIEKYLNDDISYIDRDSSYKMIDMYKRDLKENKIITNRPLWVGIKVTSRCNFKCIHCWVEKREYEPTMEEIIIALDKLKEMEVMHVTITGGEPFLRKDIIEIIKEVKKRRFHLEVFTNASLLNENIVKEIVSIIDVKNDLFQVSFDASNEKIYFNQRLCTKYERIVNNLFLLNQYGIRVRLNFTATHVNQEDILSAYKKAIDMNVIMFSISHVYDLNNGRNMYDLVDKNIFLSQVDKCIRSKRLIT